MTSELNYFRPCEAAQYVRLSINTLAKMRISGDGPKFIKAGSRCVLYARQELDGWLQGRTYSHTSEASERGAM